MEISIVKQKKRMMRLLGEAVDKAIAEETLDKHGFRKLIENADVFRADLITSIRFHSFCPTKYDGPEPITEQVQKLKHLFGIRFEIEQSILNELSTFPLPTRADGWFAIPMWDEIGLTYEIAVKRVLDLIRQTRNGNFYNHCESPLYSSLLLRQSDRTATAFNIVTKLQKGHKILIIPAQFGFCHRGRSIKRARQLMESNEFGLGAFAVGTMLLTHPSRLVQNHDLGIDCAGDEISLRSNVFRNSPVFDFGDGKLRFDTRGIDEFYGQYGSASAFFPGT